MDLLVGESVWAIVGRWCWPHWGKDWSGGVVEQAEIGQGMRTYHLQNSH